jgi:isorenieratene synthase
MQDAFPVVIIGSGLAGLTAAIHLAEQDIPPLILEADTEYPGGRLAGGAAESFEYGGRTWSFHSQHGIHAIWGGYDNMHAMLDRFLDIDLIPSPGEEWINRWGNEVRAIEAGTAVRRTWLPAPLHYLQLLFRPRFWKTITPLDFLSLPGFLVSLLWATGLDPIREEIDLEGLVMSEFFRGWTPNLRATFVGLGRSLLAAPSEKITLTGFIAAMRFFTILRRDTWRLDYFPANPHDCLLQPMIQYVQRCGGDIVYGARAKTLRQEKGLWNILVEDMKRGVSRSILAQQVILAVDPPAAQDILQSSPDTTPQAAAIKFPPALRNAVVRLWFDASPREGAMGGMFTGDFTIDNFFWLHRFQDEFKEWHAVTGGSVIETHLYASESILEKSDELLIIETTKEVLAAFPNLRGHFVHGTIRRNNTTQTQFLVPTRKSLGVETPWENLYACGDWIGYPSPSLWMERCTITGIAAANQVLRKLEKPIYEIIPPRKPEWLAGLLGGIVRLGRRILAPLIFGLARLLRRSKQD